MYGKSDIFLYIVFLPFQESEREIGCTTPYNLEKSNVCNDKDNATKAYRIFQDITVWNQTKSLQLCQKPCQQYIITFSNKEQNFIHRNYIRATLEFPKFVRVSSSSYSYTFLELIAEVGGYVGLFLGVSINQISDLFKVIF